MPIDTLLRAFKAGFSDDGAIDSQMPGLSTMMSQIPHSREKWHSARLDIDAISRDLGSANVFLTVSEFNFMCIIFAVSCSSWLSDAQYC
jgi:hypothetical protein